MGTADEAAIVGDADVGPGAGVGRGVARGAGGQPMAFSETLTGPIGSQHAGQIVPALVVGGAALLRAELGLAIPRGLGQVAERVEQTLLVVAARLGIWMARGAAVDPSSIFGRPFAVELRLALRGTAVANLPVFLEQDAGIGVPVAGLSSGAVRAPSLAEATASAAATSRHTLIVCVADLPQGGRPLKNEVTALRLEIPVIVAPHSAYGAHALCGVRRRVLDGAAGNGLPGCLIEEAGEMSNARLQRQLWSAEPQRQSRATACPVPAPRS